MRKRQGVLPQGLEERKLEIPTTTNNSLELHTSFEATPAACLQSSRSPYLYISTSTACSASPEPLRQPRPRPYTRSKPPDLPTSIPLLRQRLQRTSRAPYLYASYTSLHPQRASRSLASTRLQRISRAPYLHVPTLAAHLQTSKALDANSYTSLHPP